MNKQLQKSIVKLATAASNSTSIASKVGAGLMMQYVADVVNAQLLVKSAADQQDVMESQIDAQNTQANPVTGVVAQYMLKQPPSNLPAIVELFAQKLEQDLRTSVATGPSVNDPLKAMNDKLKLMVENMGLKMQLMQMQQQMQQPPQPPQPQQGQPPQGQPGMEQQGMEQGQPGMEQPQPGMEQGMEQGMDPNMQQQGMDPGMQQSMGGMM